MLLTKFMSESFWFFKIFAQKISSVAGLQQAYNKRKARKNGQASLSFSLVPTIKECERVICILLCLFLVFNNNIVYQIYILFVSARLVWQFSGKTEKSFCSVYQTAVERAKSRHMQSYGTIRVCTGPEAYILTGLTTDYQSWSVAVRSDTFSSGRGPTRYCSAATGSLFGGTFPFCVKINDKDKTVN